MLVMGLAMMRLYTKALEVPCCFVTPAIPVLCVVGAFAINKNLIDVVVMFFRRSLTGTLTMPAVHTKENKKLWKEKEAEK